MSELTDKWDQRYASLSTHAKSVLPTACECLVRYQRLLPRGGRALDLASGRGGNALLLAGMGFETHAWDISPVALEQCKSLASRDSLVVHTKVVDVSTQPPEPQTFDVIVVSRFLDRELFPSLKAALKFDGLLFYQTFVVGNRQGPSNPAFLLQPNELLSLCQNLHIKAYQESSPDNAETDGQGEAESDGLLRDEAFLVGQRCDTSGY